MIVPNLNISSGGDYAWIVISDLPDETKDGDLYAAFHDNKIYSTAIAIPTSDPPFNNNILRHAYFKVAIKVPILPSTYEIYKINEFGEKLFYIHSYKVNHAHEIIDEPNMLESNEAIRKKAFSDLTDEELYRCCNDLGNGLITTSDLPWKVGDRRDFKKYFYARDYSGSYPYITHEFVILDFAENATYKSVTNKKISYIIGPKTVKSSYHYDSYKVPYAYDDGTNPNIIVAGKCYTKEDLDRAGLKPTSSGYNNIYSNIGSAEINGSFYIGNGLANSVAYKTKSDKDNAWYADQNSSTNVHKYYGVPYQLINCFKPFTNVEMYLSDTCSMYKDPSNYNIITKSTKDRQYIMAGPSAKELTGTGISPEENSEVFQFRYYKDNIKNIVSELSNNDTFVLRGRSVNRNSSSNGDNAMATLEINKDGSYRVWYTYSANNEVTLYFMII